MSLVLDENERFNMQAYVTAPGPQRIVLKGMLIRTRGGRKEYTTLLPSYFYGASGAQLTGSWRQNISATGAQTILSRSGGLPEPSGSRIWKPLEPQPKVTEVMPVTASLNTQSIVIVAGIGLLLLALVVIK